MKVKKNLFWLLVLIIGSCVPVMSLHPLYNEKDVVFDEKLLGTWAIEDSNEFMEFSRMADEDKTYQLIYSKDSADPNENAKGLYVAKMVKLENKLFLDVSSLSPYGKLDEKKPPEWLFSSILFLPVHTFFRIDSLGPQLKLRLTDDDKLKDLLKKDPNVIKHEMVEGTPVLTASTSELQRFVLKYADNKDLFSTELILNRQKAKEAEKTKK